MEEPDSATSAINLGEIIVTSAYLRPRLSLITQWSLLRCLRNGVLAIKPRETRDQRQAETGRHTETLGGA